MKSKFAPLINTTKFNDQRWLSFLNEEFKKPYFVLIQEHLEKALLEKQIIFPKPKDLFKAYELCGFDITKVIILGQDPYLYENQAHGLSFSVLNNNPPPSLQNIFKEIQLEYGYLRTNANLSDWAEQGVLLLNTILTVYKGQRLSCADWGWQTLCENTIKYLNEAKTNLVFILWGAHAKLFRNLIDEKKHFVIQTAHPSPLSAHKGFFNSGIFKKTNEYLKLHKLKTVNW